MRDSLQIQDQKFFNLLRFRNSEPANLKPKETGDHPKEEEKIV